jgi:hypothetical protein
LIQDVRVIVNADRMITNFFICIRLKFLYQCYMFFDYLVLMSKENPTVMVVPGV